MIYGPWNGNISNFTWRVDPLKQVYPFNTSTKYVYMPIQWENLRSMKVKRKQLNYVPSYFTNWLWLFSPYKLPAHWVSKITALVYWFREWMEEKQENQREKPKTLTTMKKVIKWIDVRIGKSLIDKNSTVSMSDGMKRNCSLSINNLSRYPLIRRLCT